MMTKHPERETTLAKISDDTRVSWEQILAWCCGSGNSCGCSPGRIAPSFQLVSNVSAVDQNKLVYLA